MMKTRRVSVIIFYDKQKRILMQHWWPSPSPYGEEWRFFGGEIEENETPEQALVRETKEELSFDLKEYEFVMDFESEVGDTLLHRHVFISPLKDKMQKFTQTEGDKMQLFPLADILNEKLIPGDNVVIKKLKEVL